MRNFQLIGKGLDVGPLNMALQRMPHLWNQNRFRTTFENTPHVDVDDIWLRYSAPEKVDDTTNVSKVNNDPSCIWYEPWKLLPQARSLVLGLMNRVEGYELGRVIITRVRPGGRILPHADNYGSYVNLGDIGRYHIVLQGLPGSLFLCGGEQVCMQTGEVWSFNAHEVHEVANNSADDRLHLLVDIRSC